MYTLKSNRCYYIQDKINPGISMVIRDAMFTDNFLQFSIVTFIEGFGSKDLRYYYSAKDFYHQYKVQEIQYSGDNKSDYPEYLL